MFFVGVVPNISKNNCAFVLLMNASQAFETSVTTRLKDTASFSTTLAFS